MRENQEKRSVQLLKQFTLFQQEKLCALKAKVESEEREKEATYVISAPNLHADVVDLLTLHHEARLDKEILVSLSEKSRILFAQLAQKIEERVAHTDRLGPKRTGAKYQVDGTMLGLTFIYSPTGVQSREGLPTPTVEVQVDEYESTKRIFPTHHPREKYFLLGNGELHKMNYNQEAASFDVENVLSLDPTSLIISREATEMFQRFGKIIDPLFSLPRL